MKQPGLSRLDWEHREFAAPGAGPPRPTGQGGIEPPADGVRGNARAVVLTAPN